MDRDEAALLDVQQAARPILSFTEGMDLEAFLLDGKTQAAVLYEVLVLGEAVKRLSRRFRLEHPGIDWRQMSGMRDVLIHDCDRVQLVRVWAVVERHAPRLLADLDLLLRREEGEGGGPPTGGRA